jgi:hypothetical protein
VKHFATPTFWRSSRKLPQDIRELADRNFALLKTDPSHRSLSFKKVGVLWSVRVGLHYRSLAAEVDSSDLVWFWIGSHAEYDKLVGRKPVSKRTGPARAGRRSPKTRRRGRD